MLLLRNLRTKPSVTSLLSPLPTASTSSVCRFLSTTPNPDASCSPASHFAVQYLIQSCGLPSDKATRASRYLPHLKSPDKPDSMLRFLRQAGVTEPHIKAAALRGPSFLCCSVDKCFKPRMAELQEIGFSPSDISLLLSICPWAFKYTKLQQKVQFWLGFYSSVEKLLHTMKRSWFILSANIESSVKPNLAFLQEQCGLSARQISQLVNISPRTITGKPEAFKMHVIRAQELGVSCSSGMFVYALIVVSGRNKSIIDARLCYLKSLGLSQEEVTLLITKCPSVLDKTEKLIGRKMEFLLKEAGCAKIDVLRNPSLLTYSLEKRLIPRGLVQKLLKSKGIPAGNNAFMTLLKLKEKQFLEKFVLPYEGIVPGLHEAYTDACARKTAAGE